MNSLLLDSWFWKLLIALLMAGWAGLWWKESLRPALRVALWPILLAAFLAYSGAVKPGEMTSALREAWIEAADSYDLIHYYLAPKHFSQLGYFGLYPAMQVADLENDGPYFKPPRFLRFQDKDDFFWVRRDGFLANKYWHNQIKKAFTRKTWTRFSHDFLYLQRSGWMSRPSWAQLVTDRGFNGTPPWLALMEWLPRTVPVEKVKLLCYTDVALVAASALCVAWAYSAVPALLYIIFMFVTYSARWPMLGQTFGRYDYLSFMVIALSCIRKQRYVFGGIFGALAGAFRIFPVAWFTGPVVQFISSATARKALYPLLMSALLATAALWIIAIISIGPRQTGAYLSKIESHTATENLSSRREGFSLALSYDGNFSENFIDREQKEIISRQAPYRIAVGIVLFLVFTSLAARLSTDEAYALGFIPFFLFLTASHYYLVIRSLLIIVHGAGLDKFRHRVSLAYLFLVEVAAHWMMIAYPDKRVAYIGVLGWLLTGYVFLTLFLMEREQRKEAPLCH